VKTVDRPTRPRDAASIILIRPGRAGFHKDYPEVLIGRRRADLRFMPGVYAFPGGAIDRCDSQPSGFPETLPELPPGLDWRTRTQQGVFSRGVLRELYEETTLLLGTPLARQGPSSSKDLPWKAYQQASLEPAFQSVFVVARAITPTSSPRRFHNRFLLADGSLVHGTPKVTGELEDLDWVDLPGAVQLPMAEVGAMALEEAFAHWLFPSSRPAARFLWPKRRKDPHLRQAPIPPTARLRQL
jgi:8-oxo-dGTP pyrophosphatase MutT (NUDIX family)